MLCIPTVKEKLNVDLSIPSEQYSIIISYSKVLIESNLLITPRVVNSVMKFRLTESEDKSHTPKNDNSNYSSKQKVGIERTITPLTRTKKLHQTPFSDYLACEINLGMNHTCIILQ